MRIGLIIADLEMSFTTSFKYTSSVKYSVDFENSNIGDITEKLNQLKYNLQAGIYNKVHVGYDFTIENVEHIQNLLTKIIQRYKELISPTIPPNKKLYELIRQVREAETQTPEKIAKEVVNQLLTPPNQPQKMTKKQRLQADIEARTKQRHLELIKKHSAKKN